MLSDSKTEGADSFQMQISQYRKNINILIYNILLDVLDFTHILEEYGGNTINNSDKY